MSKPTKCFLRCASSSHSPILLPHLVETVLGRSPETKITDKRCSKNQLTLTADTCGMTVQVKQTGPNMSAVNGVPLTRNSERVAHHGDTIHFLLGQYEHSVEFEPKPEPSSKRPADDEPGMSKKKPCNIFLSTHFRPTGRWESVKNGQLLVYEADGIQSSKKIAAYDMDGTLILTKSGRVYPQNADDWKILIPEVAPKLRKLCGSGFKIVVFTNQAGISRGRTPAKEIQRKIENVLAVLRVPAQVFIATGDSIFRKPAPGMWDYLVSERNDEMTVDMKESFYCGDAAGRPDNWAPKKKKDFSCSDRLFARNLGLTFYTPEEHFLNLKPTKFIMPEFDPNLVPRADSSLLDPENASLTSLTQEVILMVGFPGSGKSFFCREYLVPAGYEYVNRDTLSSWQKCVESTKNALKAGKSVVIDNTNVDVESRKRFIDVTSELKIPCRCFVIGESISRARHNNKFREIIGEPHQPISEMIMNSFKSKYKEPQLSEGFQQVVKVNFKPKFLNREHERLYRMYLLDRM